MKNANFTTIQAAIKLATNFENNNANINYDYDSIVITAKTSLTSSVEITINNSDNYVYTSVANSYDDNGKFTKDYQRFVMFANHYFTQKDFIDQVSEFQIKNKLFKTSQYE